MLSARKHSVIMTGLIAAGLMVFLAPGASATVTEVRTCTDPSNSRTCVIMLVDDGKKPEVKINEGTLPRLRGDKPSPADEPPAQGAIANMCDWRRMEPQPPSAADPRWGGLDPATHIVLTRDCDENTEYTVIAADLVLPPPDPAVVAEMAIDSLTITDPSPHFGPDTVQAVNRRTYLWVDNPGPVIATAELRGVSVTATAELTSVEWSMGEPRDARGSSSNSVPEFTCAGAGRNPGLSANARIDQPQAPDTCAYIFRWRSLPERTGGTSAWDVTATSTWTVTWTSNVGAGGTDTLFGISTTPVSVGEWRSELVAGPN